MINLIHPDHLLATHRIEAAEEHRRADRRRLLRALRWATRRGPSVADDRARREVPVTGRPAVAS